MVVLSTEGWLGFRRQFWRGWSERHGRPARLGSHLTGQKPRGETSA
jgi:hypothetical protein